MWTNLAASPWSSGKRRLARRRCSQDAAIDEPIAVDDDRAVAGPATADIAAGRVGGERGEHQPVRPDHVARLRPARRSPAGMMMPEHDRTARQCSVAVHDSPAAELDAVRHPRQVIGKLAPAAIVITPGTTAASRSRHSSSTPRSRETESASSRDSHRSPATISSRISRATHACRSGISCVSIEMCGTASPDRRRAWL